MAFHRVVLGALMTAAGEAIEFLCKKDDILGATVGQLAILHTWRRDLGVHPHVHIIVTAGGWNAEQQKWVAAKQYGPNATPFLMPVKPLVRAFQYNLRRLLLSAYARGEFSEGPHEAFPMLATPIFFKGVLTRMCSTPGVARIQQPFGGPEQLLKYLGAYVNRVAISPQRVTAYDPTTGLVTYTWATNAEPDVTRTATIPATEFIRRFAQHILPPGFQRIRFRGLWCTSHRATKLKVVQKWFADQRFSQHGVAASHAPPTVPHGVPERPEPPLDKDPCRCTTCGLGRWRLVPGTWQRPTTAQRQQLLREFRHTRRTQKPLEATTPA